MQQQIVEQKNNVVKKKDRREGKGRVLAISRNVYHLLDSDTVYYVESESGEDIYYFVKFKPDGFSFCSCKDNSTRHTIKCKHLFAIEFAIKWGTIRDIDKVPTDNTTDQNTSNDMATVVPVTSRRIKSYLEDDYDF